MHATLASLTVKDGEGCELGYEYFHLELGAVSSLINNKNKGMSENQGGENKVRKNSNA